MTILALPRVACRRCGLPTSLACDGCGKRLCVACLMTHRRCA